MRILLFVIMSAVLFAAPLQAAMRKGDIEENPTYISVLASTSLTNVLTELSRNYAKQTGQTLAISFNSPKYLMEYVESGEPADIIIMEDQQGLNLLKQQGLIDVFSLSNIAENRLSLVAGKEHYISRYVKKDIAFSRLMSDLNERVLLVMGDPEELPVGQRSKQAMQFMGYWNEERAPFIVPTETAQQALYLIAKGNNAGIVYSSDAQNNEEVDILLDFPANAHDPIIYQAAVVAGIYMPEARDFMEFLKSDYARLVFQRHGFGIQ